MGIYGEMSMYGDIFIIHTQILIHAHLFSPPCVHSVWKRVVAPLRRKLTIGGNHEVKLVSKGLVNKSPRPIRNRGMPTWRLVNKVVHEEVRLRIRTGGIVLCQAALGMEIGRG
jgi:hypothetical protein